MIITVIKVLRWFRTGIVTLFMLTAVAYEL